MLRVVSKLQRIPDRPIPTIVPFSTPEGALQRSSHYKWRLPLAYWEDTWVEWINACKEPCPRTRRWPVTVRTRTRDLLIPKPKCLPQDYDPMLLSAIICIEPENVQSQNAATSAQLHTIEFYLEVLTPWTVSMIQASLQKYSQLRLLPCKIDGKLKDSLAKWKIPSSCGDQRINI